MNNFIGFFADKTTTIRYELDSNPKQGIHIFEEASATTTKLNRFTCPPLSSLLKILRPLASKCCELDPVPSSILLDCLDLLDPVIWKIVNLSLETSFMLTELKQAVIRPLVKKPGLDHQHYRNFRPISNLTFLSKAIEKAVALQLVDYTSTVMAYVKCFNLLIVLTIVLKQLLSGSTMTLFFPLTVGNLLFWFYLIFRLLLTLSIIFSCSQGYQPVLASVTMH